MHDFLSYLVKVAFRGDTYTIYGYNGKQVRDQIHSLDVIRAMVTGRKLSYRYVDQNRQGDHICYISDLRKFKSHLPGWAPQYSLSDILREIVESEHARVDNVIPVAAASRGRPRFASRLLRPDRAGQDSASTCSRLPC